MKFTIYEHLACASFVVCTVLEFFHAYLLQLVFAGFGVFWLVRGNYVEFGDFGTKYLREFISDIGKTQ